MNRYLFVIVVLLYGLHVFAENNTDYPVLRPEWEYCYEFTWFGPEYNNVSTYNNTCTDYLDETRAKGIPCAAPIVITYDGTLPDMDYLWEHHKESVLCKRSEYQRCIRYTYFYNNVIANITYMCSKVQHVNGGIINSGCFKQKLSAGYETEICVCKSTNGIIRPCNNALLVTNSFIVLTLSGLFLILSKCMF